MTQPPQNPRSTVTSLEASYFKGPLPPPEALEKYDQVVPGAAARILTMAEEQSKHRQSLEKIAVNSGAQDSRLGIICALVVALAVLALAAYSLSQGYSKEAAVIASVDIAGLAGVFVYGKASNQKERLERNRRGTLPGDASSA